MDQHSFGSAVSGVPHDGASIAARLPVLIRAAQREPVQTGGLKEVEAATHVPPARRINDRLREAVQRHPGRFAAFAAVPQVTGAR